MQIKLRDMVRSQAQMRTRYDTEKLAELTLSMYARGWDKDRLPLVRPIDGHYEIVRGHRRQMSYLMAQFLREEYPDDTPDEESGISLSALVIQDTWNLMIEEAGGIEQTVSHLLEMYGDMEIEAAVFAGDEKAAVLALQGDNMGDEEPDPLGVAQSLHYGQQLGISLARAAANMGKSLQWARQHAALAQIDQDVARRAADGEISVRIGELLMSLSDANKRAAVTRLVKEMDSRLFRITVMDKVVDTLLGWGGLDIPLTFRSQQTRNIARAMSAAWEEKVQQNPVDAYYAVVVMLYNGHYAEPWSNSNALRVWLDALNIGDARENWGQRLVRYLHEVSCATCPIANLPAERLQVDLRFPCRMGIEVDRCMFGFAPDDDLVVEVPSNWSVHDGVRQENGAYIVQGYAALSSAWEQQRDAEKKEKEEEKKKQKAAEARDRAREKKAKTSPAATPATTAAPAPPEPAGPSPTDVHRGEIRFYMETHEAYATDHFLATPCAKCKHRLDASPVASDDSVPHCAWADRFRTTSYKAFVAEQGSMVIPICDQFAPVEPWSETIPEHPHPAGMERAYMVSQIKTLVEAAGKKTYSIHPLSQLTGRPMNQAEDYSDWFNSRLDESVGELTDAQLFTLFVVALTEFERHTQRDQPFWVPTKTMAQMVRARMKKYQLVAEDK